MRSITAHSLSSIKNDSCRQSLCACSTSHLRLPTATTTISGTQQSCIRQQNSPAISLVRIQSHRLFQRYSYYLIVTLAAGKVFIVVNLPAHGVCRMCQRHPRLAVSDQDSLRIINRYIPMFFLLYSRDIIYIAEGHSGEELTRGRLYRTLIFGICQ